MNAATTLSDLYSHDDFGLSYRLAQPVPQTPRKCVILLHGVGGNESNLLDLAEGTEPQTLVIFPRGTLQLGAQQFAWFRVTFTAAGPSIVAEEAEQSRVALIHFVQQVQARHGIAPMDTVIAGFSQGGILSASVALSAPELVQGFGLLSGRILPELKPHIADPLQRAHLQAFIGHGELDTTLPVSWAQRSDQWLSELGVAHLTRLYPVGHGISPAMKTDFLRWLAGRSQVQVGAPADEA
jgi:phospholipase/carboxylesterase